MAGKGQFKTSSTFEIFLNDNPVFTVADLDLFLSTHQADSTRRTLLIRYKGQGRILSIRREFYATIPKSNLNKNFRVDPLLLASKLTPDSILSHRTALKVLGKLRGTKKKLTFTSNAKPDHFEFQGVTYQKVYTPPGLLKKNNRDFGVTTINRQGMDIKVTGLERTMVDIFSRPNLSKSWEEIWHSLESIKSFDLDMIYAYLSLLENATTFAKIGFYLEQHKKELMVDEPFLHKLAAHRPKNPHYIERQHRKNCILLSRWNLLVPKELILRSWDH